MTCSIQRSRDVSGQDGALPYGSRAGYRFCAADISNRRRLAPMGNRAIPDERTFRLSKLFQGVIDHRVGRVHYRRKDGRRPGFQGWAVWTTLAGLGEVV